MKRSLRNISRACALSLAMVYGVSSAKAQYAQIVNQLPSILSPALSGSMNYKGFVDANATFGVGPNKVTFLGVSTTQGFQYASWFFMGVGIGIDAAISTGDTYVPFGGSIPPGVSSKRAMLPLFSDFRFNIGGSGHPSLYIDVKAGAAWFLGGSGLLLNNGIMSNNTKFLLRPSLGVRIPTNKEKPKQALNVGLTYQLLTANYSWGYNGQNSTLSSVGATVSYEW